MSNLEPQTTLKCLLIYFSGVLGSKPGPLQWKHGILTTGPPAKSLTSFFIVIISLLFTAVLTTGTARNSLKCLLFPFIVKYKINSGSLEEWLIPGPELSKISLWYLVTESKKVSNGKCILSEVHRN